MSKLIKLSALLLILFFIFSLYTLTVSAEGLVPNPAPATPGGCTPEMNYNGNCGNYQLNDFVQIGILVANFLLGIVGALSLAAFVYGGIMWMISGGNAERVDIGKKAITGAVIGLVIVFTSYMIIQLVFTALGIEGTEKGQKPFGSWAISNWFK